MFAQRGIRIGIEPDRSTREPQPINSHPAALSDQDIRDLLKTFRVRGYSGTLTGLLATPPALPVFTDEELALVAPPIASALGQASARERVVFSIPNLRAPYELDRTSGALALRGRVLFFVLTDYAHLTRADTGGGDSDRDPRETKGMELYVARPARAAKLPPADLPAWGPFETVIAALEVPETLAALKSIKTPARAATSSAPVSAPAPDEELQNLRDRVDAQGRLIETLTKELERLRRELQNSRGASPGER